MQKITPFLWFDRQAEDAAKFYTSIFKNSKITDTTHYTEVGKEVHGMPAGLVMTVAFEIEGQQFTAINGGPVFTPSPAISFVIDCKDQEEVDYYWDKLSEGGNPQAQQCGWLQDRFGISWQVVPAILPQLLADPDKAKADRTMAAMLKMKKLDIAALESAAQG